MAYRPRAARSPSLRVGWRRPERPKLRVDVVRADHERRAPSRRHEWIEDVGDVVEERDAPVDFEDRSDAGQPAVFEGVVGEREEQKKKAKRCQGIEERWWIFCELKERPWRCASLLLRCLNATGSP